MSTLDEKVQAGTSALQDFFEASPQLSDQGVSWENFVAYYSGSGAPSSFIPNLGAAILDAGMTSARVNQSMVNLAKDATAQASSADPSIVLFPKYTAFFDALSSEVLTFRMEDATAIVKASGQSIADTTGQIAKTAGTIAAFGLSTYLIIAAGGAVLGLILLSSRGRRS